MRTKIPVDVLTCDPNHYVQCANMVAALDALPPVVQSVIDRHVWSTRTPEGFEAFRAFGGRIVPTMCVSGHKCFEGEVPNLDQLHAALLDAARAPEQREAVLESWTDSFEEYQPTAPPLAQLIYA
jgi:hypothetical protein